MSKLAPSLIILILAGCKDPIVTRFEAKHPKAKNVERVIINLAKFKELEKKPVGEMVEITVHTKTIALLLQIKREDGKSQGIDGFVFGGIVAGEHQSEVSLVKRGSIVIGSIWTEDGRAFVITPTVYGTAHVIYELDPDEAPKCSNR
jgi:hypothetical protein